MFFDSESKKKAHFNIDVETCIKCGGKMKIIAAIEDPEVIRKILEHMGLSPKHEQYFVLSSTRLDFYVCAIANSDLRLVIFRKKIFYKPNLEV